MKSGFTRQTIVNVRINQENKPQNNKKSVTLSPQTQKNIAGMIFPKNSKMAAMFQKALQTGDIETIEKLLAGVKGELEKDISKASTPEERAIIEQKQQQQNFLTKMIYSAYDDKGGEKSGKTENQGNGSEEKPGDKNLDEKGSQKSGPLNKTGQKDDSQNPGENQSQQEGGNSTGKEEPDQSGTDTGGRPGGGDYGEGLKAGTGTGNNKPGFKDEKDNTKRGKLMLGKREGSPVMEYINPGNGSAIPLSKILPDAKKSAETAMSRDDIPGEYEDFVGSYFMELTKEMSDTSKEGKK